MAQPLEERQILLSEMLNEKLTEILENQRSLRQQNEYLRGQNMTLVARLSKEPDAVSTDTPRTKRRRSTVSVPRELSVSISCLY